MKYDELHEQMRDYTGPMLVMHPASASIYDVPMLVDSPKHGNVYDIQLDTESGSLRFVSTRGRAFKMADIFPFDRNSPKCNARSRLEDFKEMARLSRLVRESLPELSSIERMRCCEDICSMWQASTMTQGESEESFRIGSAFENMMSKVGPMQRDFLSYVEAGCVAHASYYDFEIGHTPNRVKSFEQSARAAVYDFMDVYGKITMPTENKQFADAVAYGAKWPLGEPPKKEPDLVLLPHEQQIMIDFCKELVSVSDERSRSENAFGQPEMTGVKFKDFNITLPYGYELSIGDEALDPSWPGVGEFETVELRESCGRDFREVAKRLGYEARTPESELLNDMDDYRGPRLMKSPGEDFLHNDITGIRVCGYHTSRSYEFMLAGDDAGVGKNMIGPYGERCSERSVVPMDRSEMDEDALEIRSDEFASLRRFAVKAKEQLHLMSPDGRNEVCMAINDMWQANTLSSLESNNGYGRAFDNIQVRVPEFQEHFLEYVAAGADAYALYFEDGVSEDDVNAAFARYADTAEARAFEIAMRWDTIPGLNSYESKSMLAFAKDLNACACDASGAFTTGLRLSDFGVPIPDDISVRQNEEDVCLVIDDERFELAQAAIDGRAASNTMPGVAAKDPWCGASGRNTRDLDSAASDIESASMNESSPNCGMDLE